MLSSAHPEATATTENPSPSAPVRHLARCQKSSSSALNDIAEFDDGLLIEIAGTVADKANKADRGAEATNGEIVIASVRIENQTQEPYDAEGVLIGAKYGNGKDAQIIIDKTDELQSGFSRKDQARGRRHCHGRVCRPVQGAEEGDLHR